MLKLLRIATPDNILLPSLLYTAKNSTKMLFVFVHGAGSSSIVRNTPLFTALSDKINSINADLLVFMNRGAGYITKFDTITGESYLGGMTYEKVGDFKHDIEGVLDWARSNNYESIYLIGHSTGANKLVLNVDYINERDDIKGIALLAGGDDIALQQAALGDRLADLQEKTKQALARGAGNDLAPNNTLPHPISWQSLDELINAGSDYDIFSFGNPEKMNSIKKISKKTLVVYGSNDFGTVIDPADAIAILLTCNKHIEGVLVPDADHNFTDHEDVLADGIINKFGL